MRIFEDIDALPAFVDPVVTVGSFDGVHRGHISLLNILRAEAAATGGESVVVTFGRHPRQVLGSGVRELTTPDEKARLLTAAGVDNLVVMPFTPGIAQLPPEDFVRDFLVGRLGARRIVVGYNHRFGHDRSGDAETLEALGDKYGFTIVRAPKFTGEEEKISSTVIREALSRGDKQSAERMLGRPL